MTQKKGIKRIQRIVIIPTPDIQVISRDFMFPHDAAALIKVTKKGKAQIMETLRGLTKPGYEVSIGEGQARIIFKLAREDE